MLIGDEELNFTDEEARAIGPVRAAPTRRRNRAEDEEDGRLLAGFAGALLLMSLIFAIVPTHSHSGSSPRAAQSPDIDQQSSSNNQQTAQPEFFPAGWSYIKAATPADSIMYQGNQVVRIPEGRAFFVSLRNVNGFYLAVAEDASWNGWLKITGPERQIPMHPDFAGAKSFVEKLDWNLFESSYHIDAPSQEDDATSLGALGASEAQTERSTMLFQKKDAPQDGQEEPEITVQGEEATIPQPLAEERKVKLPKTKWYAGTEGASAPSFSWICGPWEGRAFKRSGFWGCTVNNAHLYVHCVVQDWGHSAKDSEVYIYDGTTLVCRN